MSSKPTANNGKIGSISDHVTLYPVEGSNGDGWTSDPPSAAPEGAPREGIPDNRRLTDDSIRIELKSCGCDGCYLCALGRALIDARAALRALTEERDRALDALRGLLTDYYVFMPANMRTDLTAKFAAKHPAPATPRKDGQ